MVGPSRGGACSSPDSLSPGAEWMGDGAELAPNVAVVGSLVWAVTTAAFVRARSRAATVLMLAATAVVVVACVVASSRWGARLQTSATGSRPQQHERSG